MEPAGRQLCLGFRNVRAGQSQGARGGNMTDPASYHCRLVRSEVVAEGTMAFHFLKPEEFEFRPGQAIDVTLVEPPETDGEGNTRTFSIASAPFENDLMVA